ncbi:MAG: DUF3626 domain-containing protein [Comamonas sp.]
MAAPSKQTPALSQAQQSALHAMHQRGLHRPAPAPALAAIHIHFHPDWLVGGTPIIARLAHSGRYLSQFESGCSNGSYSPEPGGQRWQWEHNWFGGAYDNAPPCERPVYGAVDLSSLSHTSPCGHGAAPRFGSAWLQLHPAAASYSSFCDPDSYWQPQHLGLWSQMDWQQLQCLALSDPLDHYVEAQVHSSLLLTRDVVAIVLDASFANTAIADTARRCGVLVRFHSGYRFTTAMLDAAAQYRGRPIADALHDMQARFAGGSALTPAHLGQAQASGGYDGQTLKKAWHCMARLGAIAADRR